MTKAHVAFGKVSKKEKSRETRNIGYKKKKKKKTQCVVDTTKRKHTQLT
jgi:hypothetical protein